MLGPLLGLIFESFARGLSRTTLVWGIVATVGVLLSVEAACTLFYGNVVREYPNFLPTSTFGLFGAQVTYEELITFLISLGATGGLYLFFRTARTGKAMRAVVDDPNLLDLAGTSPARVRRLAWVIGCTFAMISGLLLAPARRPQRVGPHAARRPGLRGGGHRRLLEPAAGPGSAACSSGWSSP